MKHPPLSVLALIVTVLLSISFAYGQQSSSGTNNDAANAELRDKAFKLLESLAGQLGSLQSAENRARMGSNIAGSLWTHDEQRARTLFASVEEDIKLGLQPQENDPNSAQTLNIFLKLREDTAERIAQQDPELALSFLMRTEPTGDEPKASRVLESERAMKLRLARRLASKSPEIAVKLARQSLANGFPEEILTLLIRVGSKDKRQAQMLYRDIVDKIRDADLTRYYPEWNFTENLTRYFTPPTADDATYRELVNIILNKAFAHGCGRPRSAQDDERTSFCIYVGGLLPEIERFSPSQAGRLRHWVGEEHPRATHLTQAYVELNDLTENGTVDEMLALLSKYPELDGQIQLRAMWKAEMLGDYDRAQKIASSYSGDQWVKGTMDARVKEYTVTAERIEAGLAQMQKELAALPVSQQIAAILINAHFLATHDRKIALRLLNQVEDMVNNLKPGKEQTEYQIKLAMTYCHAKSDRGFAIMESVLPRLNELIAAGAKLDGFDTHYLRDGEWNMTGEGTIGDMLTRLAHDAGYFARCDFDRAVTLTTQFERAEIRMMAQLKLAQGIVDRPRQLGLSRSMFYQ